MAKYREHLDKMLILLTDKYHLPDITGAPKQIAWAKDIRVKFVEVFDKQQSSIPSEVVVTVKTQILSQTESRWWIDRKDMSFEEHLLYAKTICSITDFHESKAKTQTTQNNIIVVDCQADECISVSNSTTAAPILSSYDFYDTGNYWRRDINYDDEGRAGVINSLCLALLQAGYATKIIPHAEPQNIHDGTLQFIDGCLCVVTRSEAVFKAAARIGQRRVFLDGCDKTTVLNFVNNYDVDVTADVREVFGL